MVTCCFLKLLPLQQCACVLGKNMIMISVSGICRIHHDFSDLICKWCLVMPVMARTDRWSIFYGRHCNKTLSLQVSTCSVLHISSTSSLKSLFFSFFLFWLCFGLSTYICDSILPVPVVLTGRVRLIPLFFLKKVQKKERLEHKRLLIKVTAFQLVS